MFAPQLILGSVLQSQLGNMNNFFILANVNVLPLLAAVKEHQELVNRYPERKMFSKFQQEVDEIWLHAPKFNVEDFKINMNEWYKDAFDVLPVKNYIMGLFSDVNGSEIGRSLISIIHPGKQVYEHVDIDTKDFCRFHFCLDNAPGAQFKCGHEIFEPKQGDVYWFDNQLVHSVVNNSDKTRYTMIVDIRTPFHSYYFDRLWKPKTKKGKKYERSEVLV